MASSEKRGGRRTDYTIAVQIHHGAEHKDPETERLAAEVAKLAGESKTGAVRRALKERKERLLLERGKSRYEGMMDVLERDIWPSLPPGTRGKSITRGQEEEILGFGPHGY